jgi:hypothetical protein
MKSLLHSRWFGKTSLYLRLWKFHLLSLGHRLAWQYRSAKRKVTPEQTDTFRVVFVTEYARIRECKLAHAARLHGIQTDLVACHIQDEEMARASFDRCFLAKDPWQMLSRVEEIRPRVIHLFVIRGRAHRMRIVLEKARCPVIYDPYDCARGMWNPDYEDHPAELKAERLCLERADLVCARSLEPRYLREHFGYRFKNATYFPEYCWDAPPPRNPRRIRDDEDLHIVYSGGILPEDRFSSEEGGYAQYIEVGRKLKEQRIHLHLYPAPYPGVSFEDFYSLYLKESERNSYIHIYPPLPYKALMEKLGQYDAGWHVFGLSGLDNLGQISPAKMRFSSANKIFDYLEAGLPVFIHSGFHQYGVLKHYGAAIKLRRIEDARSLLTAYCANPPTVGSKGVSLESHAGRLKQMYLEAG